MLHGPAQPLTLAWVIGNPAAKGWAVSAPETAKAIIPYHVSPVDVVWMVMLSAPRTLAEMAYHVSIHWFPPIAI